MKLSKESIEYCNTIRGNSYKGCGGDYEFCTMCRTDTKTKEELNKNTKKINEYAKANNRKRKIQSDLDSLNRCL